jgi:hypothetical protein
MLYLVRLQPQLFQPLIIFTTPLSLSNLRTAQQARVFVLYKTFRCGVMQHSSLLVPLVIY